MKESQPIFKTIFGSSWNSLPPVIHKHYANRPYCDDVVTVQGKMDVEFGRLVNIFSPFLRIFGALVPYQGYDIPVIVHFSSQPGSNAFGLNRIFNFPDDKPYVFSSKMMHIKDDIVVEFMEHGIGWKHRFYYDGEKVILEHRGYVWKIYGKLVPIPLGLFFGRGYAEEEALNDNSFRMEMTITHPLLGKMYEYKGVFEVIDE